MSSTAVAKDFVAFSCPQSEVLREVVDSKTLYARYRGDAAGFVPKFNNGLPPESWSPVLVNLHKLRRMDEAATFVASLAQNVHQMSEAELAASLAATSTLIALEDFSSATRLIEALGNVNINTRHTCFFLDDFCAKALRFEEVREPLKFFISKAVADIPDEHKNKILEAVSNISEPKFRFYMQTIPWLEKELETYIASRRFFKDTPAYRFFRDEKGITFAGLGSHSEGIVEFLTAGRNLTGNNGNIIWGELFPPDGNSTNWIDKVVHENKRNAIDFIAKNLPDEHVDRFVGALCKVKAGDKQAAWLLAFDGSKEGFCYQWLLDRSHLFSDQVFKDFVKAFLFAVKPIDKYQFSDNLLKMAARNGRVEILDWIATNRERLTESVFNKLLKAFYSEDEKSKKRWDGSPICAAISHGHLAVLDWTLKHSKLFPSKLIEDFYNSFFVPHEVRFRRGCALSDVVRNGHLNVLDWIVANRSQLPQSLYIENVFYFMLNVSANPEERSKLSRLNKVKDLVRDSIEKGKLRKLPRILGRGKLFSWTCRFNERNSPLHTIMGEGRIEFLDWFVKNRQLLPQNALAQLYEATTTGLCAEYGPHFIWWGPLAVACDNRKTEGINWFVENAKFFPKGMTDNLLTILFGGKNREYQSSTYHVPLIYDFFRWNHDKADSGWLIGLSKKLSDDTISIVFELLLLTPDDQLSPLQKSPHTLQILDWFVSVKDRLPAGSEERFFAALTGCAEPYKSIYFASKSPLHIAAGFRKAEFFDWCERNKDSLPPNALPQILDIFEGGKDGALKNAYGSCPLYSALAYGKGEVVDWYIRNKRPEEVDKVVLAFVGGKNKEFLNSEKLAPCYTFMTESLLETEHLLNFFSKYIDFISESTLELLVNSFFKMDGTVVPYEVDVKTKVPSPSRHAKIATWLFKHFDRLSEHSKKITILAGLALPSTQSPHYFDSPFVKAIAANPQILSWMSGNRKSFPDSTFNLFASAIAGGENNEYRDTISGCFLENLSKTKGGAELIRSWCKLNVASLPEAQKLRIIDEISKRVPLEAVEIAIYCNAPLLPLYTKFNKVCEGYNISFLDAQGQQTASDYLASIYDTALQNFNGNLPFFDDAFIAALKNSPTNEQKSSQVVNELRFLLSSVVTLAAKLECDKDETWKLISSELNELQLLYLKIEKESADKEFNAMFFLAKALSIKVQKIRAQNCPASLLDVKDMFDAFGKDVIIRYRAKGDASDYSDPKIVRKKSFSILSSQFGSISDWVRASHLWHRQDRNPPKALFDYEKKWNPLFRGEARFRTISATCLTTSTELEMEGKDLAHCVGGYSDRCMTGQSIIISFTKNDGPEVERLGTLELVPKEDGPIVISKTRFHERQFQAYKHETPIHKVHDAKNALIGQLVSGSLASNTHTAGSDRSFQSSFLTEKEKKTLYPEGIFPHLSIAHWQMAYGLNNLDKQLKAAFKDGD